MTDSDKEFKVEDKRRFDTDGNVREESAGEDAKDVKEGAGPGATSGPETKLPPIDFMTFVLSLASTVQMHLGLFPNPATSKVEVSLEYAKQTIDILGMLREKTKGNLDENEDKLLEHLLFELRMQYVEHKGK